MVGPFPGMDPWLEDPRLWPDLHNRLIAAIGGHLGPLLRPKYYVRLEERTYGVDAGELALIGRPDLTIARATREEAGEAPANLPGGEGVRTIVVEVPLEEEVRETYLEIRSTVGGRVVTVIEILSPGNKRPGQGRDVYEEKRRHVLATRTSLVEIDLLRAGERPRVLRLDRDSDYRILVARGPRRPLAELRLFGVRDSIPAFPVPLLSPDDEPAIDLGGLLDDLYVRAAYDLSIDYRLEPESPLAAADAAWGDARLRGAGRRP